MCVKADTVCALWEGVVTSEQGQMRQAAHVGRAPESSHPVSVAYVLAVVEAELDSPLDALLLLGVPQHEAMALLVASWTGPSTTPSPTPAVHQAEQGVPIFARLNNQRWVAVLYLPRGRWAACKIVPASQGAQWAGARNWLKRHADAAGQLRLFSLQATLLIDAL
ncbi:MAG: hypothetical protein V4623_08425 [Pseudomonadota bacterium]